MPKYGIHQIILSQAKNKLIAMGNPAANQAASDITNNVGIAHLGAIGPDLFFWAPDYDKVDKLYKLYKNIDSIVDVYNELVKPIREVKTAVGEATDQVVSTLAPATVELIKKAVEELRETAVLFQSTLSTTLFAGVITIDNWISQAPLIPSLSKGFFNMFVPELQNQLAGAKTLDIKKWYWFDALHYRNVGRFAYELNLLSKASGDSKLRAYAFGYFSHITTDVTGHAYVNQIVGAPYRLNVQRHVTVENFMDTWAYKNYYNQDVSKSLIDRLNLPAPSALGDELVEMIKNALKNSFAGSHPSLLSGDGYLNNSQIRQTYDTFYQVLKIMQKMVVEPPTEPFSGVADVLARAIDDLLEPPPFPPSNPSNSCGWGDVLSFGITSSSRDCYSEFFDQLEDWLQYLAELAMWTFETALDIIDLILATLLAIPITTLLALLYGVQLLLYQLYLLSRSVLSDNGYIYPDITEMSTSKSQTLVTTLMSCSPPFKYPHSKQDDKSHLVCSLKNIEEPPTAADFFNFSETVTPHSFMQDIPFSDAIAKQYALSPSPMDTRKLESNGSRIGNATDFTAWMIKNANTNSITDETTKAIYADWNLDSDRGYGYKSWDGAFDATNSKVTPENFTNVVAP